LKGVKLGSRGRRLLEHLGITELYPPQKEALQHTLQGRSTLVAVPTAAGKSLIAYLTLAERLRKSERALYLVPLRALAVEKYRDLRILEELFGLKVALSMGDFDRSDEHLSRYNVIVATSEKADSLLRHRAGWTEELKVVVADEIHLLGDPSRGATLEVTLARIRSLNPSAQILGLSATVRNSSEIANWLDAILVESDFRPVELREGIYHRGRIDFPLSGISQEVPDSTGDITLDLVVDCLRGGGQSLVFLSTRRSAEHTAERAGRYVKDLLKEEEARRLQQIASSLEGEESSRVISRLRRVLSRGVAFHHAGLSNEARVAVEDAFREGLIKALFATPTLAAGINLPARRVIVRDLTRYDSVQGLTYLPVREVKQMCGRAGRPQYDPWGEAVLIARNPRERDEVLQRYILGEPEPIYSTLGNFKALRTHILASFASGFTRCEEELEHFLRQTLFSHQMDYWRMDAMCQEALEFLFEEGLLRREGDVILATDFGKRCSRLYLDPLSAVIMREALLREPEEEPDEFSYLQVVSFVPDMLPLYPRSREVGSLYRVYAEREGRMLIGMPEDPLQEEIFLASLKTALFFQDWIEETPEEEIEKRYSLGPGDVHNKIELARWLLTGFRELARLFNLPRAKEIDRLLVRVDYGIREELEDLVRVRGIGRVRARTLFRVGIRSRDELARTPLAKLASLPGFGEALGRRILKEVGVLVDEGEEQKREGPQSSLEDF